MNLKDLLKTQIKTTDDESNEIDTTLNIKWIVFNGNVVDNFHPLDIDGKVYDYLIKQEDILVEDIEIELNGVNTTDETIYGKITTELSLTIKVNEEQLKYFTKGDE